MNAEEKQRIRKLFKSATNGLEYDRGVVLGSIVGELMIKLDERDQEIQDTYADYKEKDFQLRLEKAKNERLRKVLETCRRFLIRGLDEGFINDPQGNSVWIIEQIQALAGEESE